MRVWLIKWLLRLLSKLSLETVHRLATYLGQLIVRLPTRLSEVTRLNLQLCFPQLTPAAQKTLFQQSVIETCKTFSELGILWLWPPEQVLKLIKKVRGEDYLQQAIKQGRGVILLTPHLGAWELAGLYVSAHYPLTALYRPPKLTGANEWIRRTRERAGGYYMPTDQRGIRALYRALQRRRVVGILPDQVPPESGVFAPFFGKPAYTMVLVARLAQRTNAPVIFTFAERLPKGTGFQLHFLPAPSEIAAPALESAALALNQGIEICIQQCPSQYQWSYKRFKRQPPGEVPPY